MKAVRLLKQELLNIITSRIFAIISVILFVVQPLLAVVEAQNVLKIGLNAKIEDHPELAVSIPPIQFHGLDTTAFGLMAIVILCAVLGAREYKHHTMRTTLICNSNRREVYYVKHIALSIILTVMTFLANYVCVAIVNIVYGTQGLNPLLLHPDTWLYIMFSVLSFALISLLSYEIAFFTKNAIYSFIFIIPQIYFFFLKVEAKSGIYFIFPANAVKHLFFIDPVNASNNNPLLGGGILLAWVLVLIIVSRSLFVRNDLGGEY